MTPHRRILSIREKFLKHKEFLSNLANIDSKKRKNILERSSSEEQKVLRLLIFLVIDGTIPFTKSEYNTLINSRLKKYIEKHFSWKERNSKNNLTILVKINRILPLFISKIIKE